MEKANNNIITNWKVLIKTTIITKSIYFSSVHSYYARQSLNENLCVNPIQTTQCGIRSLC